MTATFSVLYRYAQTTSLHPRPSNSRLHHLPHRPGTLPLPPRACAQRPRPRRPRTMPAKPRPHPLCRHYALIALPHLGRGRGCPADLGLHAPFAMISERGGRFAKTISTVSLWIVIPFRRLSTTVRFWGRSIVSQF